MNKYIACFLFALTVFLTNTASGRDFSKRKYYKFKRGNTKPLLKPQPFKKPITIVSNKKDSFLNPIIKEEIIYEQLPTMANKIEHITIKRQKQFQSKLKVIKHINNKQKRIQPIAHKIPIKITPKEKVSAKGIIYYILSSILSICIIAGLVIGIIWLANLSLLGLIAAVFISIVIVLYIIIPITFGKAVS